MSLDSIILQNQDSVSLEDAYHRLKSHFGKEEGYLKGDNWGKKFTEIKDTQKWQYESGEMIGKIFVIVVIFLFVGAACLKMGLSGDSPYSMHLTYFGYADFAISGTAFLFVLGMLVKNAITSCKRAKISPLLTEQLDRTKVAELIIEISSQDR